MSKPRDEAKRPRGLLRRVARAFGALGVLLLFIGILAHATGCCDRLFYYPSPTTFSTPKRYGLPFESVTFPSRDGTRLSGWFIPAVGPAKGTVIQCHGNAQNMTTHWLFVQFLPERGFNLFVFDYRGYGLSEGRPGRAGTIDDARAAVDYVCGRDDVDAGRVGLLGQSLGGAIAVVVAAEDERIKGVVINSAFTSYQAVAAHTLRRNPVTWFFSWPLSRLLIRSGSDPIDFIAEIAPRPVLLIHGTADQIVPSWMSEELAERAGEPKELWLVDGGRHIEAAHRHSEEFEKRVTDLFEAAFCVGRPDGAGEPDADRQP